MGHPPLKISGVLETHFMRLNDTEKEIMLCEQK